MLDYNIIVSQTYKIRCAGKHTASTTWIDVTACAQHARNQQATSLLRPCTHGEHTRRACSAQPTRQQLAFQCSAMSCTRGACPNPAPNLHGSQRQPDRRPPDLQGVHHRPLTKQLENRSSNNKKPPRNRQETARQTDLQREEAREVRLPGRCSDWINRLQRLDGKPDTDAEASKRHDLAECELD